jgi:hypothetical protein
MLRNVSISDTATKREENTQTIFLKFFREEPKTPFMVVSLFVAVLGATMIGALVYAIRTAADGQEDETGFHYRRSHEHALHVRAITANDRSSRSETPAAVVHSRPVA